MPKNVVEIMTHSFQGGRFDSNLLDIDALPELVAFKNLLVETAKEIWRRNHRSRTRLPRGFEESLKIAFKEVRPGSAVIPLLREVEADPSSLDIGARDELDEACDVVADALEALEADAPPPPRFSRSLLPALSVYGRSLQPDESVEIKPRGRPNVVRYSVAGRSRAAACPEAGHEDVLDVAGEVRLVDLDRSHFVVRAEDGSRVEGTFDESQESLLEDALREHKNTRIRVRGKAEVGPGDKKQARLTSIECLLAGPAGGATAGPTGKPIWKVALEMGASVPVSEWAKVERDLSTNLDDYLYGSEEGS